MLARPKTKSQTGPFSAVLLKTARILPRALRMRMISANFEISYNSPSAFKLKRAETAEEIKQALQLMADTAVPGDPAYLQNSTTLFIAKWYDDVVASLGVVVDGPRGLPVEIHTSLQSFREAQKSIGEVSRLSLKKDFCLHPANVLLPLAKMVYEHCTQILHLDVLVSAITTDSQILYTDILLFKNLRGSCAFLNLDAKLPERFKAMYNLKPKNKNLYHYFVEHQPTCILTANSVTSDGAPVVRLHDRRQKSKTQMHRRTDLELKAVAFLNGSTKASDCQLVNVSETGLQVKLNHPDDTIQMGQNIFVVFEKNQQWVMCHAVVRWLESQNRVGCIVVEKTPSWEKFTSEIFGSTDAAPRKIA